MSAEQLKRFHKEHKRIDKVHLNEIGLKRVNEERQKKGCIELAQEAALPIGQELESSIANDAIPRTAIDDDAAVFSQDQALAVLPASVDNSKTIWFPPIRSQGSLGSCASFSITYTQLSYMYAFQNNLQINNSSNSNKYSPKWTYNMLNDGVDGGTYFSDNFNLLAKHGAATWAEFPYDGYDYLTWCLNTTAWQHALSVRINPVQYISIDGYSPEGASAGLQQIKQLLTDGYVLIFGTFVGSWQLTTLKNNPATAADDPFVGQQVCYWVNGASGYHSMAIVGYSDDVWTDINNNGVVNTGEKGALIIANSWGTGAGNAGFYWLAYDALSATSAVSGGPSAGRIPATYEAYEMTVKQSYTPSLIAQFTINTAKRNQLKMNLGISASTESAPTATWDPLAINFQGGPYAFNGTTTACDGTFVLDFTDLLPADDSVYNFYVGMCDNLAGNAATLKASKLIDLTTIPPTEIVATDTPKTADNSQIYSYVSYQYKTHDILPVAAMSATPTSGVSPLIVLFSGVGSYDPDGTVVSYNWDFGDGFSGTGQTVSHTYNNPGTFTARLSVTDNLNEVSTDSITINVNSEVLTYTIIATAGSNGAITPSGAVSVNYGSSQTFTITASNGYKISSIFVDGVSKGAVSTYTFSNVARAHTISATFAVTIPASPTSLTVMAISGRKITLTWLDNSTKETGFKIERSTNGTTFSQIAIVGANVKTYTNTGLISGRRYYYRVRAYNSLGNSGYSNIASVVAKS